MNELPLPFVSIVVCAYNEAKLLNSCLESLAAQRYPHDRYEVLVIDDESTDETFDIASRFVTAHAGSGARFRVVRIQHGGLSIARNAGIRLSEAEIVAFIDGDAVADVAWLEELLKPFAAGADYVGGRINLLNVESWVARFLQRTRNCQFFGPKIWNDNFIGCNMAFRRSLLNAVGGFHENFVSRGDESTLHDRIRSKYVFAPAAEAIVLHERPSTLMASIRVEWKSATLSSLCSRASGIRKSWKHGMLRVEQFLIVLFTILLGSIWFAPGLLALPLALTALAFVRRAYGRPVNRAIAMTLMRDYGVVRGTVGHLAYVWVQSCLSFIGSLVSLWLHRHDLIVEPMTTPLKAITIVDSQTCGQYN